MLWWSIKMASSPVKKLGAMDTEAIFACKVVDALLTEAKRDITVICDLTVETNSTFVPLLRNGKENAAEDLGIDALGELDIDDKKMTARSQQAFKAVPFHLEHRFITGQVFCQSLLISMVANMLYNPSLGSLVRELLYSQLVTHPVPDDWYGRTYRQLFEHMIRRRNLCVVALLRRHDAFVDAKYMDEEEFEHSRHEHGTHPQKKILVKPKVERWKPDEPPWRRYVFAMPSGDRYVAPHDGLLCIMPSTSASLV